MYNRYIPNDDGTWQKKYVREPQEPAAPVRSGCPDPAAAQPLPACPKPGAESFSPDPLCPLPQQNTCRCPRSGPETDAGSFLRRLLPDHFDTGDLMVVLLLLLIAGDCKENRNTALLTLALYFFL